MKRYIWWLVAILVVLIIILPPLLFRAWVNKADAITCVPGAGCIGGTIGHMSDKGYDKPIIVFCNYGDAFNANDNPDPDWTKERYVYEGEVSVDKCGTDTDVVWVRSGEEISCRETDRFGNHSWSVRFDAQGPHKINDAYFERYCVVGLD